MNRKQKDVLLKIGLVIGTLAIIFGIIMILNALSILKF